MKITAAVSREVGDSFSIEQLDLADLRADEILVRVVAAGICHTDHAVMHGEFSPPIDLPMVLGHEGAGVVRAVGAEVAGIAPGDHVVLTIAGCGTCGPCRRGTTGYCDAAWQANFGRARFDGSATLHADGHPVGCCFFGQSSFATYAIARAPNAVVVPPSLPLELMAPLGCGLQTGAGAVLNVLRPSAGDTIAVFGTGTVGMAAVLAARIAGCARIVAVDTKPARLDLALSLGATDAIDAGTQDVGATLASIAPRGLDGAIDTTGVPAVLASALDALRMAGTVVLVGASPPGARASLDMTSLLIGKTVRGSIQGDAVPKTFIPYLADLFAQGRFPIDRLVRRYPFAEIEQAVRDAADGTALKAVLQMPAD